MPIDLPQPAGLDYAPAPKETLGTSLKRRAVILVSFIAILWAVWIVDALIFGGRLSSLGVEPRSLFGLVGVFTMPFLHGNFSHLWNNSIAILLLGSILMFRGERDFWAVTVLGALASGFGTWLIGRGGNAVHIGASGVIFAYFGFLLTVGIFERRIGSILLSLLVFFLWGGMIWSALPGGPASISWEGHFSGLAGGMVLARLLARRRPEPTVSLNT